jgi:hypothetical protein
LRPFPTLPTHYRVHPLKFTDGTLHVLSKGVVWCGVVKYLIVSFLLLYLITLTQLKTVDRDCESEMMRKKTILAYFKALLSPGRTEENHRNYTKLETENANGHVGSMMILRSF